MRAPTVSVIVPAYNAELYIDEALQSALGQTHEHLEVIVVDDGSTDETADRVRAYGSRVGYIRQSNTGVGAARNRGVAASSGDYIAFLDADDVWRPQKLEMQLAVATRHPASGLIACDGERLIGNRLEAGSLLAHWIGERMSKSGTGELSGRFYREALENNPITSPSQMLVPRQVAREIGPMISGRNDAEDWDYTLRILLRHPVTLHEHRLVLYRVHAESRSGKESERQFVWATWDLRLLARHATLCPAEDRDFLRQVRRNAVRHYAYAAYLHARRHDPRVARTFLWWLLRQAPTDPQVLASLVATVLPQAATATIVAATRWARGRAQARRDVPR
jgi:glycosyltransferase involved in cell wall biosynthesis